MSDMGGKRTGYYTVGCSKLDTVSRRMRMCLSSGLESIGTTDMGRVTKGYKR